MESRVGLKWRSKEGGVGPVEIKREVGSGKRDGHREEEEPLSPAARMFHQPTFNVYIIAIMGCKTRIQPHVVKPNLFHTLLKHPRFSSLLVVDEKNKEEMKWVRTEVDLDKHVIVPDIDDDDPNNINSSPDKLVEDYVSNLSKTALDMSRPLWDLHLLNIKTSDAESVGVFRIHHSLGDGPSLMSLLLACTRQISNPQALPTVPVNKKKKKTTTTLMEEQKGFFLGRWLLQWVMNVWWVIQMVWNTFVDVLMFLATALFLDDTETPLKSPPGVESVPRRFVWRTVSFEDIKFIKNAMNTTVNDVALGVTQAALSRYLNRRYGEGKNEEEEATQARNNLPNNNIRLRSTLLVNIRPAAGIQALADMMEKNTEIAKWGNWIGYVLLPFTIGIRDDPLDYVREAKATVDRKKLSLEAIFTFSIAEFFLKLLGIKAASAISHRIISHTTLCFSNLVGPLEEIGYYGHPLAYLAPTSFNHPQGLMINFQSYIDKMTIVLSVDESTIPDPHQLCDDIVASLKLIKDAVVSKGYMPIAKPNNISTSGT